MIKMASALGFLVVTCTVQPVDQAGVPPPTPIPSAATTHAGTAVQAKLPSPTRAPVKTNAPSARPSPASSAGATSGPTVGVQAASTPAPRPAGGPEPLLALLEATDTSSGPNFNTVALAGGDGLARARTGFVTVAAPDLGSADTVLVPTAQVVGGAVYFMDGKGVVRRLSRSGDVRWVATFPIGSDLQEASFVVSPDESRLLASVLTTPRGGVGAYHLDLETAAAGGSTTILKHLDSAGPPAVDDSPPPANAAPSQFANLQLVGWDRRGPIALVGSYLAVQNDPFPPGHRFFGGHLARLNLDGSLGGAVGGGGCHAFSLLADGTVVCATIMTPAQAVGVSLRTADGTVLWSVDGGSCFAPSPDRNRLAMKGSVRGRDGSSTLLADGFCPLGWLDDQTLIGTPADVHWYADFPMTLVRLGDPGRIADLGFRAWYVGTAR